MDNITIGSGYKPETKRQQFELLRSQLDNERSSFTSHWRELGENILPRRTRFSISDSNKGDKRNTKIIDSTATLAARTLRAGMMSGITSPARPWKRLTTPDPGLAEFGPVKDWLDEVDRRMSTIFLKSNLYNILPITYSDIAIFGTAAQYIEEDFGKAIHNYSFPIGSYMIANNNKLKVDVFIRDFRMTVRQIVQMFGKDGSYSNMSLFVKEQYEKGNYETWIDVCHVVQPNHEYDPTKLNSKHKKYASCYYERGNMSSNGNSYINGPDADKYLRESGYDYFPVLAPRWEITGEDVYGTSCPGMEMLGDIKQLQLGEKRSMQAIEKMVNPPMVGPTILRTQPSSILPGGTTWIDERDGAGKFRAAHEINFSVNELENKQEQIRQRIKRGFFEDLWLATMNSDRREVTAREIEERHEEKLLVLGPVLERLNQDLLDPLIDITFNIMVQQELIPPPPEELQGTEIKVEYISVMAQAQKAIGLGGMERLASTIGNMVAITKDPSILDKFDADQFVDEYADGLGVPPSIIRSDEEVAAMREDRAQQQQQAQAMEAIPAAAKSAKDLASADMSTDNALTRVVNAAGG